MGVKHVNAAQRAVSQKGIQAKARLAKQRQRGSKHFGHGSNPHNGGSRGQSGQPGRRR